MGQIKAKLSQELTIAQILRDLRRESGDSERDILKLLAELVENSEFGKYRLSIYARRVEQIKSKRSDTGEEVAASIKRKIAVSFAPLAMRLRKAARDGEISSTKQIQVDGQPVAIANLVFLKQSLIAALEAERVSVPPSWTGTESSVERDQRIAQRHSELKAAGHKTPTKTIAQEERLSTARIKQIVDRARNSAPRT